MEQLTDLDPDGYTEVTYDHEAEVYRLPNGEEARFTKLVTVRLDDDVSTHKLSYTRAWMGQPTKRPVPVIRFETGTPGETVKTRLDGFQEDDSQMTGFEVANDCVSPAPRG